jgi:ribosome-binding factor A
MRIRTVPELHFEHDASVETGQRIDDLIEAALAADQRHSGDHGRSDDE